MSGKKQRVIDIRSNGKGVIGRVHDVNEKGEKIVTPFKGHTRAHMLKKVRRLYNVSTKVVFNRRGETHF